MSSKAADLERELADLEVGYRRRHYKVVHTHLIEEERLAHRARIARLAQVVKDVGILTILLEEFLLDRDSLNL